jgi:hypothetical protein
MADIFREVDEDVRRDKALDFWKQHGTKFGVLAVLIVLATAGWKAYETWQLGKAEVAGAKFEEALQLARAGKAADSEAALSSLAKDGPAGYQLLARFRDAAELAKTDREKGVAAYRALAGDSALPASMRDIARLRLGLLLVDTATLETLKPELEPLLAQGNLFGANAREVLGLSALKSGDFTAAGQYFDQIVTDREAPPALKQRADLLLAIVRAGPVKPAS